MTAMIITGFVPLPGHPRSEKRYRQLARTAFAGLSESVDVTCFEGAVEDCWLYQFINEYGGKGNKRDVHCPTADNPKKNTLNYMYVQAQKSTWLAVAASQFHADVFVWIDYGIAHLPGVDHRLIENFMARVEGEQAIAIPGCWPRGDYSEDVPNWRFCGGCIVMPAWHAIPFDQAMHREYVHYYMATGMVSWDVNTLARVEVSTDLPIWWYGPCDHDQTMFSLYTKAHGRSN
jgi:hypothetical protein